MTLIMKKVPSASCSRKQPASLFQEPSPPSRDCSIVVSRMMTVFFNLRKHGERVSDH